VRVAMPLQMLSGSEDLQSKMIIVADEKDIKILEKLTHFHASHGRGRELFGYNVYLQKT
jgi:hypothetical protein